MNPLFLKNKISEAANSVRLEKEAREASARNGGSLWYVPDEALGTNPNLCVAPEGYGFTIGASGASWAGTSGWSATEPNFGLVHSITGLPVDPDGARYVNIRMSGTFTTGGYTDFVQSAGGFFAVSPNKTYTLSGMVSVISGVLPDPNGVHLAMVYETGDGVYLSSPYAYGINDKRVSVTSTAPSLALRARIAIIASGFTDSATADFTVKCGAFKVEEGSVATPYVPVSKLGGVAVSTQNLISVPENFLDTTFWGYTGAPTFSNGSIVSPDGTMTGTFWNRTTTEPCYSASSLPKTTGLFPYTYSIHVKQGSGRYFAMRTQGIYPSRADVIFDLQTGTVASAPIAWGSFTNVNSSINAVGDGWYRVTLSAMSDNAPNVGVYFTFSSSSISIDGTDNAATATGYVWGAQLELGSSASPYVSIAKLGKANFLTDPESFGPGWLKNGVNLSPGSIIAPDGTQTASSITGTLADTFFSHSFSAINGVTYTGSIWLKVPSGTWTGNVYLTPNIGNKTITVTDTWQRYTFTGTATTTQTCYWQIGGANTLGTGVVIHAWGGQCEIAGAPSDYIPQSRINYLNLSQKNIAFQDNSGSVPVTSIGSSVGLLNDCSPSVQNPVLTITNNVLYSNDPTVGYWGKNSATVATGQPDPFGGTSAFAVVDNSDNFTHALSCYIYSFVAGNVYTQAVLAKAGSQRYVQIPFPFDAFRGPSFANFDLLRGEVTFEVGVLSCSVTPFGNGYYLCAVTAQATLSANGSSGYVWSASIPDFPFAGGYAGTGENATYFYNVGLFVGSLSAQQIAACGGIPITTTSVASASSNGQTPLLTISNYMLQSSSFSLWSNNGAISVTDNSTTDSGGWQRASTLSCAAAGSSGVFSYSTPRALTGMSVTQSVVLKLIGGNSTALILGADYAPTTIVVNPQIGTISSVTSGITQSSVVQLGNGYFLYAWSFIAPANNPAFVIYNHDTSNSVVLGIESAGQFNGTYSASQILSCGGIPRTTDSSKSNSLFASDKSKEMSLGSELVPNSGGPFTSTGSWNSVSANLTLAGGVLTTTATVADFPQCSFYAFGLEVGKKYLVSFDIDNGTTNYVSILASSNGVYPTLVSSAPAVSGRQRVSVVYTAVSTNDTFIALIQNPAIGQTFYVSKASLKQIFDVPAGKKVGYGSNLVYNSGGPYLNTTNWSNATSNLSVSNGEMIVQATGLEYGRAVQLIGVTPGATYELNYSGRLGTATLGWLLVGSSGDNPQDIKIIGFNSTTKTSGSFVFVSTGSTVLLTWQTDNTVNNGTLLAGFVSVHSTTQRNGVPAVQMTSANRPLVTQVPKKLGTNLVKSPSFENTSDWTIGGGSASYSAGALVLMKNSDSEPFAAQMLTTVPGKKYKINIVANLSGMVNNSVLYTPSPVYETILVSGSLSTTFVASFTETLLKFAVGGGTNAMGTATVSKVEVKEIVSNIPALSFDGVTQSLLTSPRIPKDATTLVWAGTLPSTDGYLKLLSFSYGGLGIVCSNGSIVFDYNGVGSILLSGAVVLFPNVPAVISVSVKSGGIATIRANGVTIATGYAGAISMTATLLGFMTDAADAYHTKGTMSLAHMSPSVIPMEDLKAIEKFAADRCGANYVNN